jgi:hypothetical protein
MAGEKILMAKHCHRSSLCLQVASKQARDMRGQTLVAASGPTHRFPKYEMSMDRDEHIDQFGSTRWEMA